MDNAVVCGDFRDHIDAVPREAIIVTDPPFNVGYHYGKYGDDMPEEEYYDMLCKLIRRFGRAVIIHYPEALHRLSIELGEPPMRVCSWVYNSNTPRQHRDVAYYGFKPDMSLVRQPYKNPTDRRIAARPEDGGKLYDWYEVDQVKNISGEKYDHPCQMPIRVMLNAIGVIPDRDALIVDPFCGTGTTLVAAEALGFRCLGFEIDPDYADIATKRLDGQTPSNVRSGQRQLRLF